MDTPDALDFWERKLSAVEALPVPSLTAGADLITQTQPFEKDLWEGVKRYCRRQGITPTIF